MSTLTTTAAGGITVPRQAQHQVTFAHVFQSEWIKFWSLRSTVWTLATTVVPKRLPALWAAGAPRDRARLLLVVDVLIRTIPADVFRNLSPYLPGTAGHQLLTSQAAIDQARAASTAPVLDPWTGYAVMLTWVAALLLVAAVLLRRRDT